MQQTGIENARHIMSNVTELPTVPDIVLRIGRKLNDTDVSFGEIADLMFQDQVLTARVLRLVNSAYYHSAKTITSLKDAVIYLGLEHIKEVIFTCAIVDLFKSCKGIFDRSILWKHALGVARVAKLIADKANIPNSENIYIAGLLHDIGTVVLNFYLPPEFARIKSLVETEKVPFQEIECRLLGTTHCEIGSFICSLWNLNDFINKTILYHHNLADAPVEHVGTIAAVNFADMYCTNHKLGFEYFGTSKWGNEEWLNHPAWQIIRESSPDVDFDEESMLSELNGNIDKIIWSIESIFFL